MNIDNAIRSKDDKSLYEFLIEAFKEQKELTLNDYLRFLKQVREKKFPSSEKLLLQKIQDKLSQAYFYDKDENDIYIYSYLTVLRENFNQLALEFLDESYFQYSQVAWNRVDLEPLIAAQTQIQSEYKISSELKNYEQLDIKGQCDALLDYLISSPLFLNKSQLYLLKKRVFYAEESERSSIHYWLELLVTQFHFSPDQKSQENIVTLINNATLNLCTAGLLENLASIQQKACQDQNFFTTLNQEKLNYIEQILKDKKDSIIRSRGSDYEMHDLTSMMLSVKEEFNLKINEQGLEPQSLLQINSTEYESILSVITEHFSQAENIENFTKNLSEKIFPQGLENIPESFQQIQLIDQKQWSLDKVSDQQVLGTRLCPQREDRILPDTLEFFYPNDDSRMTLELDKDCFGSLEGAQIALNSSALLKKWLQSQVNEKTEKNDINDFKLPYKPSPLKSTEAYILESLSIDQPQWSDSSFFKEIIGCFISSDIFFSSSRKNQFHAVIQAIAEISLMKGGLLFYPKKLTLVLQAIKSKKAEKFVPIEHGESSLEALFEKLGFVDTYFDLILNEIQEKLNEVKQQYSFQESTLFYLKELCLKKNSLDKNLYPNLYKHLEKTLLNEFFLHHHILKKLGSDEVESLNDQITTLDSVYMSLFFNLPSQEIDESNEPLSNEEIFYEKFLKETSDQLLLQLLCEKLRSYPREFQKNIFFMAIENNRLDIVQVLLTPQGPRDELTEDNLKYLAQAKDDQGYTPLIYCSQMGKVEVLETLLSLKADPDYQIENNGLSALIIAAAQGHHDVVQVLLKNNADVNLEDFEQRSALVYASRAGYLEIVQSLIIKNDFDPKSFQSWNSLGIASFEGHAEVVDALLKKNVQVRFRNMSKKSVVKDIEMILDSLKVAIDRGDFLNLNELNDIQKETISLTSRDYFLQRAEIEENNFEEFQSYLEEDIQNKKDFLVHLKYFFEHYHKIYNQIQRKDQEQRQNFMIKLAGKVSAPLAKRKIEPQNDGPVGKNQKT